MNANGDVPAETVLAEERNSSRYKRNPAHGSGFSTFPPCPQKALFVPALEVTWVPACCRPYFLRM